MLLSAMKQLGPIAVKAPMGVATLHGLETSAALNVATEPTEPDEAVAVSFHEPLISVGLPFLAVVLAAATTADSKHYKKKNDVGCE